MARKLSCFALLLLGASSMLRGSEGWARLRLGMTATETLAAIGQPLMRNYGKGFEIWIYDQKGEVVFYGGPLVAWTSPATAPAPGRAVDVWQPGIGGVNGPIFVLPAPPPRVSPNRRWEIWVPDSPIRFERRR